VLEIIGGLQRIGWEIELFEPYYSSGAKVPNRFVKLFIFLHVQLQLWAKAQNIDALYIRAHPGVFLSAIWAKIKGIPVILEVNAPHTELFVLFPWMRFISPMIKLLIWIPQKIADALIVVSPWLKEMLEKDVGQKLICVIQNGANKELFHPNAYSKYSLPKPYVVFFGALTSWHGVDIILQAIEKRQWPPEVSLVIVGSGVEQHKIEAAQVCNPKIVYLGRIPYKDMPGIIANSLAGLSPINRGENSNTIFYLSPLKVFETLACGVPAIVTDFPGQANLVRSGNCGVVIPLDDADALASAVAFLYKNPDQSKEMGRKGRSIIERAHSWDQRALETEKVIESVVKVRK
jgi:glycosyltransferase involved in cell wall biosynthesis